MFIRRAELDSLRERVLALELENKIYVLHEVLPTGRSVPLVDAVRAIVRHLRVSLAVTSAQLSEVKVIPPAT